MRRQMMKLSNFRNERLRYYAEAALIAGKDGEISSCSSHFSVMKSEGGVSELLYTCRCVEIERKYEGA